MEPPCSGVAAMLKIDDVGARLDRFAVDRHEDVAAFDSRRRRRRSGRHLDRGQALGARVPQHAVFDVVPARVRRDIRDAERHEYDDDRARNERSTPREPMSIGAVHRHTIPAVEIARLIPGLTGDIIT
jgi:hypothetical protein